MSTDQTQHKNHEISNPSTLYDPIDYGYSHVATVEPGSKLIFVAGQGGAANTMKPQSPTSAARCGRPSKI